MKDFAEKGLFTKRLEIGDISVVTPNPSLQAQILASKPKSEHQGPNPRIKVQIPATWPKF